MKKDDAERVAAAMDTTVETLRKGLEQKIFPFGGAVLTSETGGRKNYTYCLYKADVKTHLGIDIMDHVVQFD